MIEGRREGRERERERQRGLDTVTDVSFNVPCLLPLAPALAGAPLLPVFLAPPRAPPPLGTLTED